MAAVASTERARRAKKLAEIREEKRAAADLWFRTAWGDRKPEFGNVEQINLLQGWRARLHRADVEHDESAAAPALREYRVSFGDVIVYALSADEAEDMAQDEAQVDIVRDEGPAPADAEEGDVYAL